MYLGFSNMIFAGFMDAVERFCTVDSEGRKIPAMFGSVLRLQKSCKKHLFIFANYVVDTYKPETSATVLYTR